MVDSTASGRTTLAQTRPNGLGDESDLPYVAGVKATALQLGDLPLFMTADEAAQVARCTADTVRLWIRRGELAASLLGTDGRGKPRPPYSIPREALLDFMACRAVSQNQSDSARTHSRPSGHPVRPKRGRGRSAPLVSPAVRAV